MHSDTDAWPGLDRDGFAPWADRLDPQMYVVTAVDGSERSGCLVGFTTQCSMEPPRMLVCLSRLNHTHEVAARAELLAVHALDSDQHPLAELFGGETGDEVDKFDRCAWRPGPAGVPLLPGCPRTLVGRILQRIPLGDHTGHLLEPIAVLTAPGDSDLTLQQVEDVQPGHDA
jgi:flavin reductase (DIM6/NTAB) family NADH-FMN oxidoreductase RutF